MSVTYRHISHKAEGKNLVTASTVPSTAASTQQTQKSKVKEAVPAAAEGNKILGSEDWWAVFIGLGIVVLGFVLWAAGSSLNLFAAKIPSWDSWSFLFGGGDVTKNGATTHAAGLAERWPNIVLLFALFAVVFGIAAYFLKLKVSAFLGGFLALFILSFAINVFSTSKFASSYNLEAPLVALVIGNIVNAEGFFGGRCAPSCSSRSASSCSAPRCRSPRSCRPARSRSCRPRSSPSPRSSSSTSSPRRASALTSASPRRWAPAVRSAASPPASPSAPRSRAARSTSPR